MARNHQYINLFPNGFGESEEPPTKLSLPVPSGEDGTTSSLKSFDSYPSQPASTPPISKKGRTVVAPFRERANNHANGVRQPSPKTSQYHSRPEAVQGSQKSIINQFHSNLVERYLRDLTSRPKTDTWLDAPEVPTANELMDKNEAWTAVTEDGSNQVVMTGNTLRGPWHSVDVYLAAHYGMLREEAVQPLRQAISWAKAFPTAPEDTAAGGGIGIYTRVRFTTITFSSRGLGLRVVFSLSRVGKKVRWEQSKRLIAGTLVALTPTKDMFKTKCIVATVGARPLDLVNEEAPKLDLFFANPEDIDLSPTVEYTMLEERSSFFEAVRHLGVSLQKMSGEAFPLKKHIVGVDARVPPPKYIIDQPKLDLSSVFEPSNSKSYDDIDVLVDFPKDAKTSLDRSQQDALAHIFKKRVALIQGPPGTGKTHVSVMALMLLTKNMSPEDPPIVVACQTNHALDQLLRHVAKFEEKFIRLGGRSKDTGIVKERTLYNVRIKSPERFRAPGGMQSSARKQLKALEENMLEVLAPFEYGKDQSTTGFMDLETYRKAKILSQKQCDILAKGDQEWTGPSGNGKTPLAIWLDKYIVHKPRVYTPDNLGVIDFEELDLEYEQIKELEAENVAVDDENDFESLSGNGFPIFVAFSGKPANISDTDIERYLTKDDLWKVPARFRGAVFNYIQHKAVEIRNKQMHGLVDRYNTAVMRHRYGGFENNAILLRQQKVIGVTTTGLSKYRGLIAAVCPRVIMIEEAAETMEAPVTAGCVPTLEHLILVGDHKQLRPQCGVKMLEEKPFQLNVSMFERLVDNGLPYKMLKRQRRMIPEIRRLLGPIYKNDIKDHSSMHDAAVRPPVPGMGGVNSFFFSHTWPDSVDDNYSTTNLREADMVVGFYDYLISNGLIESQITILCFYNGQRKMILKQLRGHSRLKRMGNSPARNFKVLTVDSYQGEENDVILLSLAKSNDQGKIGFLSVENRICVALSRAKRGFYMFGNAELLASESKLWAKVINILLADESVIIEQDCNPPCEPLTRVVFNIPLRCTKHGRKMYIENLEAWDTIDGGCELPCGQTLPCGHQCHLHCHPFEHDKTTCLAPCINMLPCGHRCSRECFDACRCVPCYNARATRLAGPDGVVTTASSDTSSLSSNARAWHDFAQGGHIAADQALLKAQQERYLEGYLSEQTKLTTSSSSKVAVHPVEPAHIPEGVDFLPAPRLMPFAVTAPLPTDGLLRCPDLPNHRATLFSASCIIEHQGSAPTLAIITPQPIPVRKAKVSHRERFKRAAPPATPITTTSPRKDQAVQSPAPITAIPVAGYTGTPSLQMPLTPVSAHQVYNVQDVQDTPLSAYSDPFEIVEPKFSALVGLEEGQSLIDLD